MTEQLNLWKAALEVAFDKTCQVGRPKDWKLIKDALASVNAALTHPAQQLVAELAEGGDASAEVLHDDRLGCKAGQLFQDLPIGTKLYTAPPASQEQHARDSAELRRLCQARDDEAKARKAAQEQLYAERERHTAEVKKLQAEIGRLKASQEQAQQPSEPNCDRSACGDFSPGPCDHPDCHALRKQQPSGVEVVDFEAACIGYARLDGDEYKLASMRRSPLMADGQLHPIYAFPDELVERHHQQLQSFATPKPEPMTRASTQDINASRAGVDNDPDELPEPWSYRMGWRDSETHHGITKGAA